jgi:hypothetical protein
MNEHEPDGLFELPPELVPVTSKGRKRADHIVGAGEVVKAWIAGNAEADRTVATVMIKRVGRMAKSLLADGVDVEALGDVAFDAGVRGYWDLGAQWHRSQVRAKPDTGTSAMAAIERQYKADLRAVQGTGPSPGPPASRGSAIEPSRRTP